ncbi:hypothetical protein BJP39_16860 [Streptomyces sp. CC77]|nr:hypothetical protein BJP39_16860 [Streptomyces sp. CC77]
MLVVVLVLVLVLFGFLFLLFFFVLGLVMRVEFQLKAQHFHTSDSVVEAAGPSRRLPDKGDGDYPWNGRLS